MPMQMISSKESSTRLGRHRIELLLIGAGTIFLTWLVVLIWTDITYWNKDIGTILFGSRAAEDISLGIGMTFFYYLLISIALIGTGVVLFLRNILLKTRLPPVKEIGTLKVKTSTQQKTKMNLSKINKNMTAMNVDSVAALEEQFFSGCLHHFGYLSSRPKNSPIPQECILCQRLGDCMVATVYINKVRD